MGILWEFCGNLAGRGKVVSFVWPVSYENQCSKNDFKLAAFTNIYINLTTFASMWEFCGNFVGIWPGEEKLSVLFGPSRMRISVQKMILN